MITASHFTENKKIHQIGEKATQEASKKREKGNTKK